jgi:acetyl esterase/lipase
VAKFPPTLLVTSTRAMEFGTAINSHNALVKNGVEAELQVWDGLPHAFLIITNRANSIPLKSSPPQYIKSIQNKQILEERLHQPLTTS